MDEQSVAQGSPREGQSPETGSPTRAVSSADGTTKTGGDGGSSKVHDGVRWLTGSYVYILPSIGVKMMRKNLKFKVRNRWV